MLIMSSKNVKIKILALHGYRQSDTIFRAKIGSLRKYFKNTIDFIFVKAPHKLPHLDHTTAQEDSETSGYGWWFNTEDKVFKATEPSNLSVGFEESVTLIEKTVQELGPFDGILGFSQGAAFAAILCAMQQNELTPIHFKFAILISGFKSLCEPHSIFYNEKIEIPSLHVYGSGDKVIPLKMAEELSDLFIVKKTEIHEGGHYVPGKKDIYNDFVKEILTIKSQV